MMKWNSQNSWNNFPRIVVMVTHLESQLVLPCFVLIFTEFFFLFLLCLLYLYGNYIAIVWVLVCGGLVTLSVGDNL